MLKLERYEKILKIVNQDGIATVEELAAELNVSKATIRRDLVQLGEDKALLRTHGGAMKYDRALTSEVPIYLRVHMQKEEKEHVAAEAAKLVYEGATIYVSAGTTGRALASQLSQFQHLTVITNDIDVAKEISCTENTLIVIGGQLKSSSSTLYGFFAEEMLKELCMDIAFLTADGINMDKGFMDFGVDEIAIKRQIISGARHSVMMCDISKFERPALMNICPFTAVDTVITNEATDPAKITILREAGLEVRLAPQIGK